MAVKPWVLSVVGGASGAGKTTLLTRVDGVTMLNTGSLFKERMALKRRDDVRKSEWSDFEQAVKDDLVAAAQKTLSDAGEVVIDTHFAAKLHGTYRVGLRQDLLFDLCNELLDHARNCGRDLAVKVMLVTCDPQALLQRRRRDKRRERELIPSDCYNALRENRVCSRRYLFEFNRAKEISKSTNGVIDYFLIENDDLDVATARVKQLLKGA